MVAILNPTGLDGYGQAFLKPSKSMSRLSAVKVSFKHRVILRYSMFLVMSVKMFQLANIIQHSQRHLSLLMVAKIS